MPILFAVRTHSQMYISIVFYIHSSHKLSQYAGFENWNYKYMHTCTHVYLSQLNMYLEFNICCVLYMKPNSEILVAFSQVCVLHHSMKLYSIIIIIIIISEN